MSATLTVTPVPDRRNGVRTIRVPRRATGDAQRWVARSYVMSLLRALSRSFVHLDGRVTCCAPGTRAARGRLRWTATATTAFWTASGIRRARASRCSAMMTALVRCSARTRGAVRARHCTAARAVALPCAQRVPICKPRCCAGQAATAGCTFTPLSDAAADDEGTYAAQDVRYTLGQGALPVITGGEIASGQSVTVRFSSQVE